VLCADGVKHDMMATVQSAQIRWPDEGKKDAVHKGRAQGAGCYAATSC
jgi:hypothetical protein